MVSLKGLVLGVTPRTTVVYILEREERLKGEATFQKKEQCRAAIACAEVGWFGRRGHASATAARPDGSPFQWTEWICLLYFYRWALDRTNFSTYSFICRGGLIY